MTSSDSSDGDDSSVGYREPSDVLKRLFLPPKTPSLTLSSDSRWLISTGEPPLPSIEMLARPEEKLAGLRFDPTLLAPSRLDYCFDLRARHLSLDRNVPCEVQDIPLPLNSEGIRYVRFNPNPPAHAAQQFAFASKRRNERVLEAFLCNLAVRPDGRRIWEVRAVPALRDRRLNFVDGCAYRFASDGRSLLCKVVPEGHPSSPPPPPAVPSGPSVQIVAEGARRAPGRTYQDLLKSPHDEEKLRHYLAAELVAVDLTDASGTSARTIPQSRGGRLFLGLAGSPCGRFLLAQTATELSYAVPLRRFGRDVAVWDLEGDGTVAIASRPVDDEIPLSRDACSRHPRRYEWHPGRPRTLVFAHALDGGDPAADPVVDGDRAYRDAVYAQDVAAAEDGRCSAGDPAALCRLEWRYDDVDFTESGTVFVDEYRWRDRRTRKWRIPPGTTSPKLVWERSWEDRYASPGAPLRRRGIGGRHFVSEPAPGVIFLQGAGASPLGDRPFLDRLDLETGVNQRLWRCPAPTEGDLPIQNDPESPSEVGGRIPSSDERADVYETLVALLDDDDTILIGREGKTTPRNYHLASLTDSAAEIAVTAFPHPQPDLVGVTKELVRYARADGVALTANLYLPANYDDTPRPTLFWAYPREFKSSGAAGQVRGSPHRFVSASWASPVHWAARGWAVVDDFSLPVIGEGDAHPNDTFVQQIVAGAQAAVNHAVERGVADPDRCAVGGHSYGSFMTAHLLSHTGLFAAGVGRSGAFNRTLTPMSFQSEDRSLWEARDTYVNMSPLMHVKKHSEQERVGKMLLIHGEADENAGTHPLQSERYFAALKAFGIQSRLCLLPHERHSYRARESILHMAWEQEQWLKSLE